MAADYELVKNYDLAGIRVTSEITTNEAGNLPNSRFLIIRSSCASQRWGTRTQNHTYTCPLDYPEFAAELEKIRSTAAETLVKAERGELPEGGLQGMVPEIFGPTGKRMTPFSVPALNIPMTLLSPEFITLLELVPNGQRYWQVDQNRVSPVPLYGARIKFGSFDVETIVAPMGPSSSGQGGPACVLGGDFFQKALADRSELIIELVMADHYRTLANAARCKKRYVLIAGKYGEHRPRLERIKAALSSVGLVGLILDEYPDIEEQSLAEKMVTYASICRFVIVDDLVPSGHINELGICHERKFITAILREKGKPATAMQADIASDVSFIKQVDYASEGDLDDAVRQAVDWANKAVLDRASTLNRLYSDWRSPEKIMR